MTVFFYTEAMHSDYFKELLKSKTISYEFQIDEAENKFYFGIDKRNMKEARHLNYLVFARFRKPFIPHRTSKYLLIIITLLFIILALIGYLKS